MFFIFDLIEYCRKPRYVIMRGCHIDNRALLFLGANAEYMNIDGISYVEFSNHLKLFLVEKYRYYSRNIYKRIWTKKELRRWRKLLGSDAGVLQQKKGKWIEIPRKAT